ncbi:BMP family ABC transporter substrate-binding protein [Leifsonia shinshuensis]|uniref:BMP family ABC transporter substrate-binding protein n=1 Tax=Leifsonia shinshuensis TaxID=150026 RepID=UPI001F50A057|nr:BMP family ABC transporter substrate-binding protein [Leifsonia shinshuensis]MCI0158004.1 BMP family ABC transporter substrate-binding protein [Leifsonia shinshuensis]
MPRLHPRAPLVAAVCAAAALLFSGCAALAPEPVTTGASGVQPLGSGFLGSVTTPTPEATIEPERGSWDGVEPPAGYTVVVVSAGADSATSTLVSGVTRWARQRGVTVTALTARGDDEVEDQLLRAIETSPDLVIGAGPDVVDVFSLTTAQHLHQQFLIVGAELPEPTANVTSVIWAGASFRGTGISQDGDIDPTAVTARRATDAVSAGVASVLHGLTGIVLHLK